MTTPASQSTGANGPHTRLVLRLPPVIRTNVRSTIPDIIAKAATPLVAEAERPALLAWLSEVLEAGSAHRRGFWSPDTVLRHVMALPLGDGAARRFLLLTLRDSDDPATSAFRAAGERLDAMARTAGVLCHTVNNALTAVLGNAEYLAELTDLPAEAHEAAGLILTASERLEALTRRTSRLTRAARPPDGACQPAATLQALVARLRPGLPATVRLELTARQGLGTLLTDARALDLAVEELLTNAIAAVGPAGGRILMTARLSPGRTWPGFGWLAIAVQDDGPGLQEADWGEGFLGSARHGGRQPIGLAIVRTFAHALDGGFTAERLPEGGTKVTLRLPVLLEETA